MAIFSPKSSLRQTLGNFTEKVGDTLGIPESNWSERIAGGPTQRSNVAYASEGPMVLGDTTQPYSPGPNASYLPPGYQPPPPTTTTNTGNIGGGGSSGNLNIPQASLISPDTKIGGLSQSDVINGEFDTFSKYLGDQQGLAEQRFANTQGAIASERDTAVTDANAQRGIRTQELTQKAESGRANERLNLQKVRQLLQDLEQKNAARIAVTGGGGSTTEALADRFGRTAQQNVGGVLQEGQRYQNDVETEKVRTNQFYDNAIQKIKDTATASINDARYKLNENLSSIDSERRSSAQQKTTARYDAWRGYYDQINKAKIEAANFKSQYDVWLQGKTQELAAAGSFQLNNIQGQDVSAYTGAGDYSLGAGGVGGTQPVSYAPTTLKRGQTDEEQQYGMSTPSVA